MRRTSDLVRDSQLLTAVRGDITLHVIETSGHDRHHRRVRKKERWQRLETLGHGTFGIVWKEKLIAGESKVNERAVKMIRKTLGKKTVDYSRELEAIAKFSGSKYNPYFVQSYGWYESQEAVFITMEFIESGDLHEYLLEVTRMTEEDVQQVSYQILEGVKHMHDNDFAHRDLKPSNILIRRVKSKDEGWWVKISDFGISKRVEDNMTALRTCSGTAGFLAPEVLVQSGLLDAPILANENGYTFAVDIWSLGEIIYRAICGVSPFNARLAEYANLKTGFPLAKLRELDIGEPGVDLIQKLMKAKPDERLTAKQALEHPWFKEIGEDSPRSSGESLRLGSIQSNLLSPDFSHGSSGNSSFDITETSAQWSTIDGATTLGHVENLGQASTPTESKANASSSPNVPSNDGEIDDNTISPPTIKATGIRPSPDAPVEDENSEDPPPPPLLPPLPPPVERFRVSTSSPSREQEALSKHARTSIRRINALIEEGNIENLPPPPPPIGEGWVSTSSPSREQESLSKRSRTSIRRIHVPLEEEDREDPPPPPPPHLVEVDRVPTPSPPREQETTSKRSRTSIRRTPAPVEEEDREYPPPPPPPPPPVLDKVWVPTSSPPREQDSLSKRSRTSIRRTPAPVEEEDREYPPPPPPPPPPVLDKVWVPTSSPPREQESLSKRSRISIRRTPVPLEEEDRAYPPPPPSPLPPPKKGYSVWVPMEEEDSENEPQPPPPPPPPHWVEADRVPMRSPSREQETPSHRRRPKRISRRTPAPIEEEDSYEPQPPPPPLPPIEEAWVSTREEILSEDIRRSIRRTPAPNAAYSKRPSPSLDAELHVEPRRQYMRTESPGRRRKSSSPKSRAKYEKELSETLEESRRRKSNRTSGSHGRSAIRNRKVHLSEFDENEVNQHSPQQVSILLPTRRGIDPSKSTPSCDSKPNSQNIFYSDSTENIPGTVYHHRESRKRPDKDDYSGFIHNTAGTSVPSSPIQVSLLPLTRPPTRPSTYLPLPRQPSDREHKHVHTRTSRTTRPRSDSMSSYSSSESTTRRHPPSNSKTSRTSRFLGKVAGAASIFGLRKKQGSDDDGNDANDDNDDMICHRGSEPESEYNETARGDRLDRDETSYYSEYRPKLPK